MHCLCGYQILVQQNFGDPVGNLPLNDSNLNSNIIFSHEISLTEVEMQLITSHITGCRYVSADLLRVWLKLMKYFLLKLKFMLKNCKSQPDSRNFRCSNPGCLSTYGLSSVVLVITKQKQKHSVLGCLSIQTMIKSWKTGQLNQFKC